MQKPKAFFCKDLSGRGYTVTLTDIELLDWNNETDDSDVELHEFVSEAEIGDKWRTNSEEVIRVQ